jgi:hypothetical protein
MGAAWGMDALASAAKRLRLCEVGSKWSFEEG